MQWGSEKHLAGNCRVVARLVASSSYQTDIKEFADIATAAAGARVSQHLPRLMQWGLWLYSVHHHTWSDLPTPGHRQIDREISCIAPTNSTESPNKWVFRDCLKEWKGSPGLGSPEFFRFSKKCPKCKTYIWNAEMTKVIVRWLLLDWNHRMSVHAMNFHFYLWLFKILWPENTSSHISRHLEFIMEQGDRVNWVSGSLDSLVTGSLGHKMWPSSVSANHSATEPTRLQQRTRKHKLARRSVPGLSLSFGGGLR